MLQEVLLKQTASLGSTQEYTTLNVSYYTAATLEPAVSHRFLSTIASSRSGFPTAPDIIGG